MTTTDKSKVIMPTSKGSEEITEKRHSELVPFTSPSRATDAEKANVTPSPTGKPLINAAALAARSDALANEKAVIVLFPKSGRSMVWNYMKLFKFSAGFAMHGLERYLIDAGDLYAPVNDILWSRLALKITWTPVTTMRRTTMTHLPISTRSLASSSMPASLMMAQRSQTPSSCRRRCRSCRNLN